MDKKDTWIHGYKKRRRAKTGAAGIALTFCRQRGEDVSVFALCPDPALIQYLKIYLTGKVKGL